MDKLVAEARETGMAKTMFGRIRTLADINSKNLRAVPLPSGRR